MLSALALNILISSLQAAPIQEGKVLTLFYPIDPSINDAHLTQNPFYTFGEKLRTIDFQKPEHGDLKSKRNQPWKRITKRVTSNKRTR